MLVGWIQQEAYRRVLLQEQSWSRKGSSFRDMLLYHGGERKITKLDPSKFQSRDSGFYGMGFYVGTSPSFAKSYGNVISAFTVAPSARILFANALRPEAADRSLVDAVVDDFLERARPKARARGKEADLEFEADQIRSNNLAWSRALQRFGVDKDFDIVWHPDGEIVVVNDRALIPAEVV